MDKLTWVKFLIAYLLVTLSLIGLNAKMYNWRWKKFYINQFLVMWCMAAAVIFNLVYTRRLYYEIITSGFDLKNAVKLYFYMNVIGGIMNYLWQLMNCKAAVDFVNQVQLFTTMKYFDIDVAAIKSTILLVTLKTLIFPTVIAIAVILRKLHNGFDITQSIVFTLYVSYPIFCANITPNCLFGIFVVCRQLTLALNRNLSKLEKEANFLQDSKQMRLHKHFYRVQRFCHMADKLDELAEKYATICSQTLQYMSLGALPLLISLVCNLLGITVGLFRQYYDLADTLINEESYDIFRSVSNGIFLIISFLEIALHSLVGNQTIMEVRNVNGTQMM